MRPAGGDFEVGDASGGPLSVLGVEVANVSMDEAIRRLEALLAEPEGRTRTVFFANANTVNLATRDPGFRSVLRSADHVFADGAGVRWAARLLHGVRLRGNVNGTDLVPRLLRSRVAGARRYFLLGTAPDAIERAARHVRSTFPDWTLVGYQHGYFDVAASGGIVDAINRVHPELLLVGMGQPRQERWIRLHREQLKVPLCIAVGGLFAYWAGDLDRAPVWLRRLGLEWIHLVIRQPHKLPRYLLGNPEFLLRIGRRKWRGSDLEAS